ncbi:MAG TPA: hypothetical protein VLN08_14540 [Vicinamibacterales bacterium]|nr:hypothetical protein [Vicinamibacterales bacterium]
MPVLALNLHAGFACRQSGACCTAGWPIPVEPAAADAIRARACLPGTALSTAGPLPHGAAAVLVPLPGGACPAFDRAGGNRCSVQTQLGHGGLPASCRHFPRVALLEEDAVRVTLSHFCPTAAWMLFTPAPERLAIVRDAAGIADRREHEGFDARQTIPPFLRPGVAMDAGTCRVWERCVIGALDCDGLSAEAALAATARTAEAIRGWTAGATSLEDHAARAAAVAGAAGEPPARIMPLREALRLHAAAAGLVPAELRRPDLPAGLAEADLGRVQPRWAAHARPVRRYLAARAFAAWSAYLGEGLRTQVAMLAVALAAVRVEAAREAALARRPLDDEMLHAAIRSADLLLHHLSDAAALVGRFAGVEQGPAQAFRRAIGIEATLTLIC